MKLSQSYKVKKAMIVDDTEVDQFIIASLIKASSFAENICIHSNPEQALSALKNEKRVDYFPEVIFLDLQMPVLNGFEFLEEFANLDKNLINNCKVVLLTSTNNRTDLLRAAENPLINKLLYKPLTLEAITTLKKIFWN